MRKEIRLYASRRDDGAGGRERKERKADFKMEWSRSSLQGGEGIYLRVGTVWAEKERRGVGGDKPLPSEIETDEGQTPNG